jgi:hypothetical protein
MELRRLVLPICLLLAMFAFRGVAAEVPAEPVEHWALNGKALPVEIPAQPSLNIGSSGAIALWCRPDAPHGGLFSFGLESEGGNRNFAVVFDTRTDWGDPANELRLWAGGSRQYQTYSTELPDLPVGQWTHVVVSIDGPVLRFYFDAEPVMEVTLPFVMDLSKQGLNIGRYAWSGDDDFDGTIDDVAIFAQPLSREQVRELYRQRCASFGHDVARLSQPSVEAHVQAEAGRIVVRARQGQMKSLPAGATFRATLMGTNVASSAPVDAASRPALVQLEAAGVPAGTYELQCEVVGSNRQRIGKPARQKVEWPGRDASFANVRVLNNLVWELLNEKPGRVNDQREYPFTQPKRRWIYVRSDASSVEVVVDGKQVPQPEAMVFLDRGEHTIGLKPTSADARVESLVVRSIPQLIFDSLIPEPHINSTIAFDEDFIRKHVVPSVNTFTLIERSKPETERPLFREMIGTGRHFVGHSLVPTTAGDKPITADGAFDAIVGAWGMRHPELNGSIADEFGMSQPHCAAYADAIRRLHGDSRFAGRQYIPYVGRLYTGEAGRQLVQALVDTGSAFAFKCYLPTPATEQAAYDAAWRRLVTEANYFRARCSPKAIESMIVCFGYFCTPNEFLNVVPQVNYKTFLDMQFRLVATQPEFWATRGLQNYFVHYADEETTRWIVHLFRHYGIEGSTEPAAVDPFDSSPLLADGDFVEGTKHWRIEPAAPGSVEVVDEIHFAWLQGRYPYTPGGDSALRMTRSAERPNVASQTIRNLKPGRLYATRMISAVQGDMSEPSSTQKGLRLDVRGAQVLPEPSYSREFHNSYAHAYGPFGTDRPAWMTYHWVLFRAEGEEAELRVSDWTADGQPAGPVGQPMIFNFAQVQPYFGDFEE